MFSITAINDKDSGGKWENLAPSKEAEEFRLTQNYHDGLKNLHAKNFSKAQQLLESVLRDPLISSAVHSDDNDSHLRQLRFLSLKNLASVFLQQGDSFYQNALQCYLQAVEIDDRDPVVWNKLGSLSCSMGLLSISRWAFEQGLVCSPNNWNCMEKLLEVLIAIGDEVSCLSVSNLILRHWPSHSRALRVKNTIECQEPLIFGPRGIDNIQPEHARLVFSTKRKGVEGNEVDQPLLKKRARSTEVFLEKVTWESLASAVLDAMMCTDLVNNDTKVIIHLSPKSPSKELKMEPDVARNDSPSLPVHDLEKTGADTQQENCVEEDQLHEKRVTRLRRLRSRKTEAETDTSKQKDLEETVRGFLEPFIMKNSSLDVISVGDNVSSSSALHYSSTDEYNDVTAFVMSIDQNFGFCHIGHLLLEEIASKKNIPYHSSIVKLLNLEKLTRTFGRDRTPLCTLFLAELYYDEGLVTEDDPKRKELWEGALYHLCKIVELLSLDFCPDSFHLPGEIDGSNKDFWVRFFWLSGCVSVYDSTKEKAIQELSICLSILKDSECSISLPHCRIVKSLSVDRVQHQLNLMRIDSLLKEATILTSKGEHRGSIDLLSPIFLSTEGTHSDYTFRSVREDLRSVEIEALDLLLSACEKEDPFDVEVFFRCLKRKLLMQSPSTESTIKVISQSLTKAKNVKDAAAFHTIGEIQSLLVPVMCDAVKEPKSGVLVDAAVAFCKLQHVDSSVPIKTQVDLIVSVHDLLAEYGLCCAGGGSDDSEGCEGAFLKFAIKHLLALDVKLKSTLCSSDKKNNGTEETDSEEAELDNALDQSFFCLYGLNLKTGQDSFNEEDLAAHRNTNRGDLHTMEQCADVFQYILPYARASSRTGIVKLRKVLRAIRKHFPQPPDEMLAQSNIQKFLEDPDFHEEELCEFAMSTDDDRASDSVLGKVNLGNLGSVNSEPYLEVYSNLYFLLAQAEEMSATDKIPGFVLKKEGEEFVEQNTNLLKYDLMYNPLRFESWQKLADVYDEEVDLLLNDGSKHINAAEWRKNLTLPQRVELGRRCTRRCLLMSLALARTQDERSQVHELLGLVYYDSLQNVVPFYDQRSTVPSRDATWRDFCERSLRHFEVAFSLKKEWLHTFYMGKICEKMGYSSEKALSYYSKAASLNPSAVDPLYRLHASRIKLLSGLGSRNLVVLRTVAAYPFREPTTGQVAELLGSGVDKPLEPQQLDQAWRLLYEDCLAGLEACVEGELKHFHRARYRLAQGLYRRGDPGDLDRAKEELGFCFRSSRSSFTFNMWEIDSVSKKGKRRAHYSEVALPESSRKFITCIRKYVLFYTFLLEESKDWSTLERAYNYVRSDKWFSLSLADIVPIVLGRYVRALSRLVNAPLPPDDPALTLDALLERMFGVLLDHVTQLGDLGSPPEVACPELSETSLCGYILRFISRLEADARVDMLESVNERIRKRFKTPKLSSPNLARICRHASAAWCRAIVARLAQLTAVAVAPLPPVEGRAQLAVDLHPEEIYAEEEGSCHVTALARIRDVRVGQAADGDVESATALLRSAYALFRDSTCGTFPSGIRLYVLMVDPVNPESTVNGAIDLSVPRKLLIWAYTLAQGQYAGIATVIKFCEDNVKSRARKLTAASSTPALPAQQAGDADEAPPSLMRPPLVPCSSNQDEPVD